MTEGLSAKQAARQLDIEPRILRKFLRSDASPFESVGQGQRYVFDAEDMKVLRKAFYDSRPHKATRKTHYHEPDDVDLVPEPDRSEDAEHWEAENPEDQDLDLDDLEHPFEVEEEDLDFDPEDTWDENFE